jgi:pimeloyl-ACP methyl ester carboxylesterase
MIHGTTGRPVVVFVHGFGSNSACWTRTAARRPERTAPRLGDLMSEDPVCEAWDLDYFEYATGLFGLKPLWQIPDIFAIGEQLKTWLRAKEYHRRPVTLVGHSQGGLVILSYLWNMLEEREAPALSHVRQVILIATPQKGSALLLGARGLLGRFIGNAQEVRLRPLNADVGKLLEKITRDVINADGRLDQDRWPVPIRSFYGTSDKVVVKEAARGELDPSVLDSLDGDHFTVLRPTNRDDPKYRAIRQAIQSPVGHKKVFRVARFHTNLQVSPVAKHVHMTFKKRSGPIEIRTTARLDRHVTFSENNLCEKRFNLRYRTLEPTGYLEYVTGGAAQDRTDVSASALQDYTDEGRQIRFSYRPRKLAPAEYCFLNLTLYNAFNASNQNVHFHLQPLDEPLRLIEKLEYEIDLSAYARAGVEISPPRLFHYPHNPAVCDDLCGARVETYRREPAAADPLAGVWRWELRDVIGGVVDIVWETRVADAMSRTEALI